MSFLSIHLSHYVATQENSLPRMRTGYERVVAHRCKLPFAYSAEYDGVIESINEDAHVLVVSYPKQNKKVAVEYGEIYTNNGGGGFYCTQRIVVNDFKVGDKVKQSFHNFNIMRTELFQSGPRLIFFPMEEVTSIQSAPPCRTRLRPRQTRTTTPHSGNSFSGFWRYRHPAA